jgi:ABC-type amino acid transport substrate-binding protein
VIYNEDGTLGGVSIWLWEEIEEDLNKPFKIKRYPEAHSLKLILEDLKSGVIDLSINPLTITGDRYQHMDFTSPFFIGNLTVATNTSSRLRYLKTFFRDFLRSRVLWLILILGGMVILFGGLVWLVERKNHHFERNLQGLLSSFWWSAVTMTTVGYGDKVPISNLGRFIAFLWMLCSIIIISIFTASITSGLTVQRMAATDLSVKTFSSEPVGTVEASASLEYLEANFYRNLTSYPDLRDGLKALNREEVRYFIYDEPWLIYQLQNNPDFSETEILPVRFHRQLYAMPLNQDMPFSLKRRISYLLLRLQETRDWEVLLNEYQLKLY